VVKVTLIEKLDANVEYRSPEVIRIFVGTDRSQFLAVSVLEHSIKRYTKAPIEVYAMLDLPIRQPKDPREHQRTGFSFSRFCIPQLCGYQGKALYMDADMLVRKDISELWQMSFDGAKIIIQEDLNKIQSNTEGKSGAPKKRIKQCAVMLIDCEKANWNIESIVDGIDARKYNYDELFYHLCILSETEIKFGIPFRWNSLEHFDSTTANIHYTDVYTQPWSSPFNKNAEPWFQEVRLMLENGSLTWNQIETEIAQGFFRPSLIQDLKWGHRVPKILRSAWNHLNHKADLRKKYVPHKAVYEAKKERMRLVRKFEGEKQLEN
jgi:lipopolysaccharide biosynthesis glycosyltransferase